MSKVKNLLPDLRFPEFANDGEWEEHDLIEVADKNVKWSFTGGPFGSDLKANEYTLNGVRIIQLQNIGDGKFNNEYKIYTSKEKADELLSSNIFAGDIIISKMGDPVGRACIIPEDLKRCVMASDGIRLVVNEKENSKYFIYSLINSKRIRKKIERKATGSTRKRIALKNLKKIPLPLPKKSEQQKIADCLSSLDQLITAHGDKLEALKTYKKGLLQNLFPKEGEKVPKHRFSEFEKDGEWVEKKLGEFGDPKMCKRIFKDQTTPNPEDGIPFYKIGTFDGEADAYISKELYKEYKSNYNFPNKGDILISASGTIGRLVVYDGAPAYFQDSNIVWLENDESLILNTFLYYCYSIVKWQTSDGGVIKRLYNSDLKNIPIRFPKEKAEQQKIASSLSAVDELINDQEKKLEQLELHKKGLMQGLFPKLED